MTRIETVIVTGRVRKPWRLKINPIWWFANDDEQQLADAPWYRPGWPQWRRGLYWYYLRNPCQNLRAYVLGVSDRNYEVWGPPAVMVVQLDDLDPPRRGLKWSVIRLGRLRLPFASYSGKRIVWQLGWQPSGFLGAKLNVRHKPLIWASRR